MKEGCQNLDDEENVTLSKKFGLPHLFFKNVQHFQYFDEIRGVISVILNHSTLAKLNIFKVNVKNRVGGGGVS